MCTCRWKINPFRVNIIVLYISTFQIVITKKSDNLIEINETRADGKKAKVLFAIEGNKLKLVSFCWQCLHSH